MGRSNQTWDVSQSNQQELVGPFFGPFFGRVKTIKNNKWILDHNYDDVEHERRWSVPTECPSVPAGLRWVMFQWEIHQPSLITLITLDRTWKIMEEGTWWKHVVCRCSSSTPHVMTFVLFFRCKLHTLTLYAMGCFRSSRRVQRSGLETRVAHPKSRWMEGLQPSWRPGRQDAPLLSGA